MSLSACWKPFIAPVAASSAVTARLRVIADPNIAKIIATEPHCSGKLFFAGGLYGESFVSGYFHLSLSSCAFCAALILTVVALAASSASCFSNSRFFCISSRSHFRRSCSCSCRRLYVSISIRSICCFVSVSGVGVTTGGAATVGAGPGAGAGVGAGAALVGAPYIWASRVGAPVTAGALAGGGASGLTAGASVGVGPRASLDVKLPVGAPSSRSLTSV